MVRQRHVAGETESHLTLQDIPVRRRKATGFALNSPRFYRIFVVEKRGSSFVAFGPDC